MDKPILEVHNLSKQYKLGQFGTGTLSHDINRFLARIRGKEDPYLMVSNTNDRTASGTEGYVWALRDISFNVQQGEILGIIGRNGAGKSTLLKLLSRITTPTKGEITLRGRLGSLLEVGTGFHQELTGKENIFLNGAIMGMSKAEINSKLDEIIEFSGCQKYIDTPVKRYSSGMMVRLGFAVAAHLEPEILIVDEVLAVGDLEFQKKCIGKMKDVSKSGRTVLFVSHNMSSISDLCDRTILMNNGTIIEDGPTDQIIESYRQLNRQSSFNAGDDSNKELFFKSVSSDLNGETLSLEIEVERKLDISNAMCGILIKDSWNQKVSTVYRNIDMTKKTMKIVVNLDVSVLVNGSYGVDTALFIPRVTNYDYQESCVTFTLLKKNSKEFFEGQNVGAVKLDSKWEIY